MLIARPYQKEAIKCMWNADLVALVVMASGLGKTISASEFAKEWILERGGKVLYLVHLVDVVQQARRAFEGTFFGTGIDTGSITGFESDNPNATLLFSTIQSMVKRKEEYDPEEFSLIIYDEAHHGVARTHFDTLSYFTPEKVVALTATPDRMDGGDIISLFGEPVFEYPFSKGIIDGWLSKVDYQIKTDNISEETLKAIKKRLSLGKKDITKGDIDRTVFLEERLDTIVSHIKAQQKKQRRPQTVIFCRSIVHLKEVQRFLPEGEAYHSKLTRERQRQILSKFRTGDIKTLLVVNKFNEAIDIPDAKFLVFLRATESRTVWLQQLGRGLRKTETKRKVVVFDFVANCDRLRNIQLMIRELQQSRGKPVSKIIRVSGTGWDFIFDTKVKDIFEVLDLIERGHYDNLEEAKEAVKRLNEQLVEKGKKPALTNREYKTKICPLDPLLSTRPDERYKKKGWTGWNDFLGTINKADKYCDYAAAKAAVQRLNKKLEMAGKDPITSSIRYREKCELDPKLPKRPESYYKDIGWTNWPDFLDSILPYETHTEAQAAVQKLNDILIKEGNPPISNGAEYRRYYHRDKRLIHNPDQRYRGKGWKNIAHFLKLASVNFYTSYKEAKKAVQKLNSQLGGKITSWKTYRVNHESDPRLPPYPDRYYRGNGWVSWYDFLGKDGSCPPYSSYDEAKKALKKLNEKRVARGDEPITTFALYQRYHGEDPSLPSNLYRRYKGKGWEGFQEFCGSQRTR